MLPNPTLRRLLVVLTFLLAVPAIASAAPLETDLGERLSAALAALAVPGG